jgi:AraC-like DNA-binding protein
MEQAVRLMDGGKHNLTEIAQEIGCFDTSHFNKKFKAVYGISPRQYLEQKQRGGDGSA